MKATSTKTRIKFSEWLKDRKSVNMKVYHVSNKPDNLLTINEVKEKYSEYMSEHTIKLYASTGKFIHPFAIMVSNKALSWLYLDTMVEEYFSDRKPFDKEKYDAMVEQSRALQARGARLRYKADKMKHKFQLTIKESK